MRQLRKVLTTLILAFGLVSGASIAVSAAANDTSTMDQMSSCMTNNKADEDTPNVKLIAQYNVKDVSNDDLKVFKTIQKEHPELNMVIDKNDQFYTFTTTSINNMLRSNGKVPETKTIIFNNIQSLSSFPADAVVADFDAMDGISENTTPGLLRAYPGQKDGQKVKTGTHVHCNRFNGWYSDHKYWTKAHPSAYRDFLGSDCAAAMYKYHCSSIGSMTKCDGLNTRGKGVKDCSSVFGWPKTAWYRN